MTTIAYEFTSDIFGALRLSPTEFAREMRIAAAIECYAQGRISQSRAEFIEELFHRLKGSNYIKLGCNRAIAYCVGLD